MAVDKIARHVADALAEGGINVGVIASEPVPFGCVKQPGLEREGSSHRMGDIQK